MLNIRTWIASKNVELKPKLNIGIAVSLVLQMTSANFQLILKPLLSIHPSFTKLRLYCHKGKESFDIKIRSDKTKEWIDVNCSSRHFALRESYYQFLLILCIKINKTSEEQKYFELYGIEIQE